MKINAYQIKTDDDSNLNTLLQFIKTKSELERIRDTPTSRMRLEVAQKKRTSGNWLLDFTKFTSSGPGKAPESALTEDFDLQDDEFFGQETAAFYIPVHNYLILQHNHSGPRSASIETYFNIMNDEARRQRLVSMNDISITPIARTDSAARLERSALVKRLEFTINVPGAQNVAPERRGSLGSFLDNPVVATAKTISVQISAGHSHGLLATQAKQMVSDMLGIGDNISRLTIKSSEGPDDPIEIIDLLEARLMLEKPMLSGRKGRHDRAERWQALESAFADWQRDGSLT